MLTERDKAIIAYLKTHGKTDTNTLHELFFSGINKRWVNARLKQLTEWGYIRRYRNHEQLCYVYYVD